MPAIEARDELLRGVEIVLRQGVRKRLAHQDRGSGGIG
jgi:hypothetical protein